MKNILHYWTYFRDYFQSCIAKLIRGVSRKERKGRIPLLLTVPLYILVFGIIKNSAPSIDTSGYQRFNYDDDYNPIVPLYVPYNPNFCTGTLAVMAPNQQETDGISLVVREAALDRRYISLRDAKLLHPGEEEFLRLQFLLSVIPDPKKDMKTYILEVEKSIQQNATIHYSDGRLSQKLHVKLDYILEDGRCQRNCNEFSTCRVREWQAIITVLRRNVGEDDENLENSMQKLIDANGFLRLNVPVIIRDTWKVETVVLDVGLGCIAGLSANSKSLTFPHVTPAERNECYQAGGALGLSGTALFGDMRYSETAWRSIAHYAARHLFGHTWYDTVAVALFPEFTISEIMQLCSKTDSSECPDNYHSKNMGYFNNVRRVVEDELAALSIPKTEWRRLVLFQFCGLGTDSQGSEKNSPCAASFYHGQKVLGYIGYTHFGHSHSWASNFDLDEILVDETALASTSGDSKYQSAYDRFQDLRVKTGKTSYFFEWMDFSVEHQDQRQFTTDVMQGKRVGFTSRNHPRNDLNLTDCYGGGGKVISHCSVTAGFMVHYASIPERPHLARVHCRPKRGPKYLPTERNETELYTWHARGKPRQGNCAYSPKAYVEEEGCLVRPRSADSCSAAVDN